MRITEVVCFIFAIGLMVFLIRTVGRPDANLDQPVSPQTRDDARLAATEKSTTFQDFEETPWLAGMQQ